MIIWTIAKGCIKELLHNLQLKETQMQLSRENKNQEYFLLKTSIFQGQNDTHHIYIKDEPNQQEF